MTASIDRIDFLFFLEIIKLPLLVDAELKSCTDKNDQGFEKQTHFTEKRE